MPEVNAREWVEFLREYPDTHILQSAEWGELKSSFGWRVTRLVTGASLSGANGMHFGPDGFLYVASVLGSEIVVLDPETGEIKRRIADGVTGPDDIAFASDGSDLWDFFFSDSDPTPADKGD